MMFLYVYTHCEMITTIKLMNISISPHSCHLCVCDESI